MIMGGDFNADPGLVSKLIEEGGWPLAVVAAAEATCTTKDGESRIDFFVVSRPVRHLVSKVSVAGAALATHSPVRIDINYWENNLLTWWDKPPPPSGDAVVGPRREGVWLGAERSIQDLRNHMNRKCGSHYGAGFGMAAGQAMVDEVWEEWLAAAVPEWIAATGDDTFAKAGQNPIFRQISAAEAAA